MGKRKSKKKNKSRHICLKTGCVLVVVLAIWGAAGEWFVHHPRSWISSQPAALSKVLCWIGNPLADVTDAFGWTGYDTICEYDTEAPSGSVFFAGAPKRIAGPAPQDIRILDRGEFKIGWSDTLRHPVWCAYHVTRDARYENAKRPGFTKDRSLSRTPAPGDYTKSGYDRGHMVPNYAIVTRYGEEAQKLTFCMSNIASPTSGRLATAKSGLSSAASPQPRTARRSAVPISTFRRPITRLSSPRKAWTSGLSPSSSTSPSDGRPGPRGTSSQLTNWKV